MVLYGQRVCLAVMPDLETQPVGYTSCGAQPKALLRQGENLLSYPTAKHNVRCYSVEHILHLCLVQRPYPAKELSIYLCVIAKYSL